MEQIKYFEQFLNERELPDSQGEVLVILGAPGSGKGTLAKVLKDDYGINHISTGDLIRKSDDDELKKIIASGDLVPDSMIVKILVSELEKMDPSEGVIFDGFPRTIKQAKKLDSILGKMGLGLNHAIFLDLDEKIAKERIKERAKKEDRKDDSSDEVIENRFNEYHDKTFPLVDFYKRSRKLLKIDAEGGKDSVRDILNKKKKDDNTRRIILRDIFDSLINYLKNSGKAEIRNVKDFETNEMSYLLNLYLESDNIYADFYEILENNGIVLDRHEIDSKNSLYVANFGKIMLSNLNLDSICFLELKITGKYFSTLRITLKAEDISYRVYDTNYFYLKFWVFDGINFSNHDIQIRTQDRNKNKMRVDLNNGYFFNIVFDKMGEVVETNISKKRGAKQNP